MCPAGVIGNAAGSRRAPALELADGGSRTMLEAVACRLVPPPGIHSELAWLQGEPATEPLAFAKDFDIERSPRA